MKAAGWQEAVETGLHFEASPEGQDWWQDLSGGQSAHHRGMEDVEDGAGAAERAWDLLQERRRAARDSMERPEDVGSSFESDVSPEGLGGGQDLSVGQSVLHTNMEDTEDKPNTKEQLLEAVEATALLGTGKEGARNVREQGWLKRLGVS